MLVPNSKLGFIYFVFYLNISNYYFDITEKGRFNKRRPDCVTILHGVELFLIQININENSIL